MHMATFHTIVAAIDFSDTSLAAARTAADLAREAHGRLHLMHVVPNVFETPWLVSTHGIAVTRLQNDLIHDAKHKLAEIAATEPFRTVQATCMVGTGSAADAIVEYAVEGGADLIVLGTHGYGAVKRFLLGHVADRVIRHARCAVLALPHEMLRQDNTKPAPETTVRLTTS
jgi:nucleotide-binding universal stress UspA family protein